MAKNLMTDVAKLLGVELNEAFEVTNGKHTSKAIIINNTFCEITREGMTNPNSLLLQVVLKGEFSVQKLPWKPKLDEEFYSICFSNIKQPPYVYCYRWRDDEFDFCKLGMGIVYRTKAEAEAHLADDYKKLTGQNIEEIKKQFADEYKRVTGKKIEV